MAPLSSEKEKATEGLHQVSIWKGTGKEKVENCSESCESFASSSHLERGRNTPFSESRTENDLVLHELSSAKQPKSPYMQSMQESLEFGLAAAQKASSQPQQSTEAKVTKSQPEFEAVQGNESGNCPFSRNSPMDYIDSEFQTAVNIPGRSDQGHGATTRATGTSFGATSSSGDWGSRRDFDRGGKRALESSERCEKHDAVTARDERALREADRKREEFGPSPSFDTWAPQQAEKDESTDCSSRCKNQTARSRVVHDSEGGNEPVPTACASVSDVTSEPDGEVQPKAPRVERSTCNSEPSFAVSPGGGASAGRDGCSRHWRTVGSDAKSDCTDTGVRLDRQRCRSHGGGSRGSSGSGRGRRTQCREQGQEAPYSRLQEIPITTQSGNAAPQNQATQGMRSCIRGGGDRNVNSKQVRFAESVELHVWHGGDKKCAQIPCMSLHEWCRSWWQFQGDFCSWSQFKHLERIVKYVPWLYVKAGIQGSDACQSESRVQNDQRNPSDELDAVECDQTASQSTIENVEWKSLEGSTIETWYLNGHLRVCPHSRQVPMSRGDSFDDFKRKCQDVWQDFVIEGDLTVKFVRNNQNRKPRAILVQHTCRLIAVPCCSGTKVFPFCRSTEPSCTIDVP